METKKSQIIEYLKSHPGDRRGAMIEVGCTIQYVDEVIRTENRVTKRGKRSILKDEDLALAINEIGFDGKGEPIVWNFKILKELLEEKGIGLSTSQLTKIMNNAGFNSKEVMLNLKKTSWYKWTSFSDKKEARKQGNTILMLDVIENRLEFKVWLENHTIQGPDNRMKHEASKHYYAFMTMRGELFLLAKFGKFKDTAETVLSSMLTHFRKQEGTNKLVIVVPDLIEQVSGKLGRFLKENESQITLRETDYDYMKRQVLPDRYVDPRQFTYEREEKEEERERKEREKMDAKFNEEFLAWQRENETLLKQYDNP